MKINYLIFLIGIVVLTACTDTPYTATVGTVPAPTPTPENYGLYTDSDLQIYADSIDLRIQQALKNNNSGQAQELGRKRQELIAEFNRRHLKRSHVALSSHPHYSQTPKPQTPKPQPLKRSDSGLPGEN